MNSSNGDEQGTIGAELIFVPPKPCRRQPLNRMMDVDRSPAGMRKRCSSSPESRFNDAYDSDMSDDCNISADDDDLEYENNEDSTANVSPNYLPESCYYKPPPEYEGSRLRISPNSPSESEKSPKTRSDKSSIKNSQIYEISEKTSSRSYSRESNERLENSPSTDSYHGTQRKNSISKAKRKKEIKSSMPKACYVCAVIMSMVVGVLWFSSLDTAHSSMIIPAILKQNPDRPTIIKNFRQDIKDLRSQFPGQDHSTWIQILAGVTDVINQSKKPWMFVLFSNETRVLSCLAEKLGEASSKALLTKGSLMLEPKDMGNEYGVTIDRLLPQIKEKKAVVVQDLLHIDPGAIQAFHTMCDKENPLVKEAVYIMTIITHDYVPGNQSPEQFVENQLTNRFIDKVPVDKLQPLITRLTDGPIIPVAPEVSLTGCTS